MKRTRTEVVDDLPSKSSVSPTLRQRSNNYKRAGSVGALETDTTDHHLPRRPSTAQGPMNTAIVDSQPFPNEWRGSGNSTTLPSLATFLQKSAPPQQPFEQFDPAYYFQPPAQPPPPPANGYYPYPPTDFRKPTKPPKVPPPYPSPALDATSLPSPTLRSNYTNQPYPSNHIPSPRSSIESPPTPSALWGHRPQPATNGSGSSYRGSMDDSSQQQKVVAYDPAAFYLSRTRKGEDLGLDLADFDVLDTLGTGTFGRVRRPRSFACDGFDLSSFHGRSCWSD